jgi:hypothetical protein
MHLPKLRGDDCSDGRTCPAVHQTDRGTLVIIGTLVSDPAMLDELAIGPGERAVEVPLSLIPEVADA